MPQAIECPTPHVIMSKPSPPRYGGHRQEVVAQAPSGHVPSCDPLVICSVCSTPLWGISIIYSNQLFTMRPPPPSWSQGKGIQGALEQLAQIMGAEDVDDILDKFKVGAQIQVHNVKCPQHCPSGVPSGKAPHGCVNKIGDQCCSAH